MHKFVSFLHQFMMRIYVKGNTKFRLQVTVQNVLKYNAGKSLKQAVRQNKCMYYSKCMILCEREREREREKGGELMERDDHH